MSSPKLKKKNKLVPTKQRIKQAFLSLTQNLSNLTAAFCSKLYLNPST